MLNSVERSVYPLRSFDLHHAPEKVWRALTDRVLLTEWPQPVVGLELEPGVAVAFNAHPEPGLHPSPLADRCRRPGADNTFSSRPRAACPLCPG